jgi:hypothetical protein
MVPCSSPSAARRSSAPQQATPTLRRVLPVPVDRALQETKAQSGVRGRSTPISSAQRRSCFRPHPHPHPCAARPPGSHSRQRTAPPRPRTCTRWEENALKAETIEAGQARGLPRRVSQAALRRTQAGPQIRAAERRHAHPSRIKHACDAAHGSFPVARPARRATLPRGPRQTAQHNETPTRRRVPPIPRRAGERRWAA